MRPLYWRISTIFQFGVKRDGAERGSQQQRGKKDDRHMNEREKRAIFLFRSDLQQFSGSASSSKPSL